MLEEVQVKILDPRIGTEFPLPKYQHEGDAAIDLVACVEGTTVLHPGDNPTLVGTGIAVYIANPNYVGLIVPRSGLGHKSGIVTGNIVGVIDASYQGELKVSAWNRSSAPFFLKPGERFAQLLIVPVMHPKLRFVSDFDQVTTRGTNGFGSTGTR